MTPQRQILPEVIAAILAEHPECSILLIGSVARGEERPENSDLDLNLFFPAEPGESKWVRPSNRWQLEVVSEHRGVRLDFAWETFEFLEAHLRTAGPFWILSSGEVLHDPSGRLAPCLRLAQQWAAAHPEECAKIEAEFRRAKARQQARYRGEEG